MTTETYDFGLTSAKNVRLNTALSKARQNANDRSGLPIIARSCVYLEFGTDPSVYTSEVDAKIVDWLNTNVCAEHGWEDMTVGDLNFG